MTEPIEVHPTVLCAAVRKGILQIVRDLLKDGADVNIIDKSNEFKGMAPLHIAVSWNRVKITNLLIRYGANVNIKDDEGNTPIVYAIEERNTKLVKQFLRNGADTKDLRVLYTAIKNGNLEILEDLLKDGVDVNVKHDSNLFNSLTPLHAAVRWDQVIIAKLLINYGANVNVKDNKGNTPIFHAINKRNAEMIQLLLSNGADMTDHCKLLCPVVAYGHLKLVQDLLKDGAEVNMIANSNVFNGLTPLHTAARWNKMAIAKLLINYGADVNVEDNVGNTPLVYAIQNGYMEMIELLLINGADMKDYRKLLCAAVSSGCLKLVQDLLKAGADVNLTANSNMFKGLTPLHTAVHWNQMKIAKLLINYGANVNVKDNEGETPLGAAIRNEDLDMIKLLLISGADIRKHRDLLCAAVAYGCSKVVEDLLKDDANIDRIDNSDLFGGLTPLHTAVEYNQMEMAELLIKYGANVNVEDLEGITPVVYAMDNCDTEMVELLLLNGADIQKDPNLLYANCQSTVLLKQHIAKMKAAGLYVSERNLQCISNDYEINNFECKCQAEIKIMKREKIGNSCAFFNDILAKNTSELAKNKRIVQALESDEYKEKFPIYASMIESRFRRAVEREEILEQVRDIFLPFLFGSFKGLPHLCTEKIFSYLSDNDLTILLDACELD